MAAPMKSHARVCLTFENGDVESSWFLVKYNEMPQISDIAQKINCNFLDLTSRKKRLVLRLRSAVLPNWESSEILQDDDRITVSVERVPSSRLKQIEPLDEAKAEDEGYTAERKKRKREDTESRECDEERPKEKKKKSKEPFSVALGQDIYTIEVVESPIQKRDNTEPKKPDSLSDGSEHKVWKPITSEKESKLPVIISEKDVDLDETTSDVNTSTKKKRKRIRKHRKKKSIQMDICDKEDVSNVYKGREVGKDELFFGSIPDKLLDPKYYRHGYKNLKVFQPEPNKHTKFESDEEVMESESTEQYNFLSNTKLLEEREALKSDKDGDKLYESTSENDFQTKNNEKSVNKQQWYVNKDDKNNSNLVNNSPSGTVNNHTLDISKSAAKNDKDIVSNGYHSDTVHSNNYTDQPFKYPGSEPRPIRTDVNQVPSQLTRKTLTSGASVFVRQRPGRRQQQNPQYEISKMDQLNTVATNISTIFVNPNSSTPKQVEPVSANQPSLEQNGTSLAREINPVVSIHGSVDYSKLPPLKGEPKKGDKIIYKILEISETCTPEISDYKEALVLRVDKNQMVELKNIGGTTETKKNIFHVELEDENEVLTNTAENEEVVQLHLSSLLEPRVLSSTS